MGNKPPVTVIDPDMPDSESFSTSDSPPESSGTEPRATAISNHAAGSDGSNTGRPPDGPLADGFKEAKEASVPSPTQRLLPTNWQGRGVVGAIAAGLLPLIFFGLVVWQWLPDAPSSVVESSGMGLRTRFLLLWLASMGLTVLGVGLFTVRWSQQILRTIVKMTEVVRSLHQDPWTTPIPQSDLKEVEALANSLTTLAQHLRLLCQERDQQNQALQTMTDELEDRISQRTAQLHSVIKQLKQEIWERKQTEGQLQQSQAKLIHSEKMSGLGQMVAGIAHEINNPINFIHGNLKHIQRYVQDILVLLEMYQTLYPDTPPEVEAIAEELDIQFLEKDLGKMVASMRLGTDRILGIVRSLRTFSRMDQVEFKRTDIHDGIDSTLLILKHRLKAYPNRPQVIVVKQYAPDLPLVECHAGQINQVFMNIITNALDALDESGDLCLQKSEPPMLIISTQTVGDQSVAIQISDNGPGIPAETQSRLFDPFFTTKPVGKGTGLGMSISYTIVTETHGGNLQLVSSSGKGASFLIELPISQKTR